MASCGGCLLDRMAAGAQCDSQQSLHVCDVPGAEMHVGRDVQDLMRHLVHEEKTTEEEQASTVLDTARAAWGTGDPLMLSSQLCRRRWGANTRAAHAKCIQQTQKYKGFYEVKG